MACLVLQSFGREYEYKRALLTIFSYCAHALAADDGEVLLFTDNPEFFKPFVAGLNISYIMLTPEKIRSMRGEIDFLHRMKIALIDEAFQLTEGNILYADSDTFFTADPGPFERLLKVDKCYMHLWEYTFSMLKDAKLPAGQTAQAFYKIITSRSFIDAEGAPINVSPQMSSWNAGVMFFHRSHARFIPDVYTLTDQFYPETQNHASEQFAFSIVLQNHIEIEACDAVVYHYWYRVKKQLTDHFLSQRLTLSWAEKSLDVKIKEAMNWTKELPLLYENHVWTIRDHAIQDFNENRFASGYKWALKAIAKEPMGSGAFIKDTFYHVIRQFRSRG